MPALTTSLHGLGGLKPLPALMSVLVGLAAFAVVLWQTANHISTMAHEGAHALVGSTMGRKVRSVRLERNGDGSTLLDPATGPGFVVAGIVGYLGPSGFGLLGAKLISLGYAGAALWLAVILLAVLLPLIRNWFGVIPVVVTGGSIFLVLAHATAGFVTVVACGLTWFLLLSGVGDVLVHNTRAQDAQTLRNLTYIPKALWVGLWLMGTILALIIGGALLL
ncbi:MAG TPA: M50 family metallopeptidase [Streptosporangiaceae bacterium]|nr:M50 family metallopeptidase [Streptosporangiaceae bacterium]